VISTPPATPYRHSTPIHVAIVGATDFESRLPRKMVDAMLTALERSMATPSISPLAIATGKPREVGTLHHNGPLFRDAIDPLKDPCCGASAAPSVRLGHNRSLRNRNGSLSVDPPKWLAEHSSQPRYMHSDISSSASEQLAARVATGTRFIFSANTTKTDRGWALRLAMIITASCGFRC